ncbi:MAG: hypothetical protein HC817_09485 [Saprospiraceae bacterium]|nr:hypothetical protein [Saprospiraceae bacterium]
MPDLAGAMQLLAMFKTQDASLQSKIATHLKQVLKTVTIYTPVYQSIEGLLFFSTK